MQATTDNGTLRGVASLEIRSGPLTGQTIELTDEVVIGRENADVTIDDAQISRRHAVVRSVVGAVEVEDLGSSNGTFVDEQRIEAPTRVGGGAKIRLGATVLEVTGVLPVQATRVSGVADPQVTRARPIADPQVTRARPIADPQVTRARPIADPQVTRARPIADPQVTRARPIADPQVTRARPIADPQTTDPGRAPAEVAGAASVPAPSPPAPAAPAAALGSARSVSLVVGEFVPPTARRSRGLASRSWAPVVLSFGTVVLTAIALVIYFASQ